MAKHWGKVLTAMVTPFDGDGRLNLDMACTLARHLAASGSDGLVLAATTGEAPTLSDAERFDLIRAVSEAVTVPVLAGTGSNNTRHALDMTAKAEAAGAAGVFLVSPYYNRPPQAGIEAHFRALAAATRLPVMLYDVPGRTGRRIAHEVLLRLFREVDNIVAFKDATGDPAAAAELVAEAGDQFELYSGDDALTLSLLAVGAVGVVGTSTHWTGPEFAAMIAAFEQGDVVRSREINAALLPSYAYSNTDDSVYSMSVKAMLRSQGLAVGECRLPLPAAPAGVEARAAEVWSGLQAWRAGQR
ncbi:4-hydroxy-tetrahydrodipicolinate synthase [Chromobacterium vaccinii]|uniref:4-hydroxy-tetrahydrodipicolinate synthase n=1 Tax=Chromobacterium vaccinii TaxID=1108595 RepID=UPI000CE98E11|nr:4-hydroxy-tetrahydrodipicolinate synthase [Chromobacterium vaccinii]AVG17110.1 4-hydroxy-tetrahydrodipicolinate synthase [Chromobacterium vaccinii]